MSRRMSLCPGCKTIQKAEAICSICGERVAPSGAQTTIRKRSARWRSAGWRDTLNAPAWRATRKRGNE